MKHAATIVFSAMVLYLFATAIAMPQPPSFALLQTGTYLAKDLQIPSRGYWMALCEDGNFYPTTISLLPTQNPCEPADTTLEALQISNDVCDDALLLLNSSVPIIPDSIAVYEFDRDSSVITIDVAGDTATIAEQPFGTNGFELIFAYDTTQQTIYQTDWTDEGGWEVIWCGDLNNDGAPDFLMWVSHKYSVQSLRLYLSQKTAAGIELVKAAEFRTTSC